MLGQISIFICNDICTEGLMRTGPTKLVRTVVHTVPGSSTEGVLRSLSVLCFRVLQDCLNKKKMAFGIRATVKAILFL